jgi:hypothetical protein
VFDSPCERFIRFVRCERRQVVCVGDMSSTHESVASAFSLPWSSIVPRATDSREVRHCRISEQSVGLGPTDVDLVRELQAQLQARRVSRARTVFGERSTAAS